MSESTLRHYIRQLLREVELGGGHSLMGNAGMGHHTLQSPGDNQYSYDDIIGVNVDIFPTVDGKTHVQVISHEDDKLTSPVRVFPNEEEAKNFARKYTEKIKRIMMSRQN